MFIETIKIVDGTVRNLALHQQRVLRSVARYGGGGYGCAVVLRDVVGVGAELSSGVVKCRVVYDLTGVREVTYEPYVVRRLRSLRLVEVDRRFDYSVKFEDRSVFDALLEARQGCDDVLIVQGGLVTDISYANVLLERGGEWFTPSTPLLRGTKREWLLSEGVVREEVIPVGRLAEYSRLKIVNAMIDPEDEVVMDVGQILW